MASSPTLDEEELKKLNEEKKKDVDALFYIQMVLQNQSFQEQLGLSMLKKFGKPEEFQGTHY